MTVIAQILELIETKAKLIQISNGYQTDIGLNVSHWRDIGFEFDSSGLNVQEVSSSVTQRNQSHEHQQRIEVVAFTYVAAQATLDATNLAIRTAFDDLRSDLFRLIRENQTWGGLAFNTLPSPEETTAQMVETQGKHALKFGLEFDVCYRTNPWEV